MPRRRDPAILVTEFFETAELATAQTVLSIVDAIVRRRRGELSTAVGLRRGPLQNVKKRKTTDAAVDPSARTAEG
jgi:hypothetical protein